MLSLCLRASSCRLLTGLHTRISQCYSVKVPSTMAVSRCLWLERARSASEGRRSVTRLQWYAFGRYLEYVRHFQRVLESEFPRAFRLYRVFTVGVKDFLHDVKEFVQLARKVQTMGLRSLSRRQLELYLQQPRDMRQVAPVLLVAALPLAQNVVFPLAYLLPRQLLSRHFWSLQQRAEFALHEHRKRLFFYRPVLRHLQARVMLVHDAESQRACRHVLTLLGSGLHPSATDVLALRPAFDEGLFSLGRLSAIQVRRLLKLHGLSVLTLRRRRSLREYGELLRHMDAAMFREGVTDMSTDELYYACFLRGLNPQNLPYDQMVRWLSQWSVVSAQIEPAQVSLLLHCPLLLAYNQPTNWALIH